MRGRFSLVHVGVAAAIAAATVTAIGLAQSVVRRVLPARRCASRSCRADLSTLDRLLTTSAPKAFHCARLRSSRLRCRYERQLHDPDLRDRDRDQRHGGPPDR
jgi:hypothetical protein